MSEPSADKHSFLCMLKVAIKNVAVRVTVSSGFMLLVKELTIFVQNGKRSPHPSLPIIFGFGPQERYHYIDLNLN